MYISASDLHHFAFYWIITIQHSLVCEFTCPDTFTTRLCSVLCFPSFVSCLCSFCCYSTSASDCLKRLGSEMTLSYNLLMSTSSLTSNTFNNTKWSVDYQMSTTNTYASTHRQQINTRCYMNENETTATESAIHRQDSYNRKLNQFHVCSMHWLDEYPALCDC